MVGQRKWVLSHWGCKGHGYDGMATQQVPFDVSYGHAHKMTCKPASALTDGLGLGHDISISTNMK